MTSGAPRLIAYFVRLEDLHDDKIEFLVIDFYQIGSHENFYDDLKRYLKSEGWYK